MSYKVKTDVLFLKVKADVLIIMLVIIVYAQHHTFVISAFLVF